MSSSHVMCFTCLEAMSVKISLCFQLLWCCQGIKTFPLVHLALLLPRPFLWTRTCLLECKLAFCSCLWTYLQFYQISYIQSCTRMWNYLCVCIRIYNSYLPTCTRVGSHVIVKFLGIEGCGVFWRWRIELHNNATSFTMEG
jgi:hypothetical protein